jgi:hypothetical protein
MFDFTPIADGLPDDLTADRLRLFCRFHQLETWFRELVYVEMKAYYGAEWWKECQAALKRSKAGGISPEKSLLRDGRHPHMATPESDPLWFLSFDSLLRLLFDQKLWKLFSPYLTTKQLVRAKFAELMPIRNRIAHCRALHQDDLARVEHVMRDFDQGFWRFVTSYNAHRTFVVKKDDPDLDSVFKFVRYGLQTSRHSYADVSFVLRPSAKLRGPRIAGKKGVLYKAHFIAQHPLRFETEDILRASAHEHPDIVHIAVDSLEQRLGVSIPAVLGTDRILRIINRFDHLCRNSTTPFRHASPDFDEPKKSRRRKKSSWADSPGRKVAADWPHCILSPSNPLTFLNPDNPCSFFGV